MLHCRVASSPCAETIDLSLDLNRKELSCCYVVALRLGRLFAYMQSGLYVLYDHSLFRYFQFVAFNSELARFLSNFNSFYSCFLTKLQHFKYRSNAKYLRYPGYSSTCSNLRARDQERELLAHLQTCTASARILQYAP